MFKPFPDVEGGVVVTSRWASQNQMQPEWNVETKPPRDVCPERFCLHWAEAGDKVTAIGRVYDTLDNAINDAAAVSTARCACSYGACIRDQRAASDVDWYEPCEPALLKAGLPWFYFIASIKQLGEEFHARYIAQSTDIWGQHDGLK